MTPTAATPTVATHVAVVAEVGADTLVGGRR
jgi:hypothetical protein